MCARSHGAAFRTQRDIEIESLRHLLARYRVDLDPIELSEPLFHYWRTPSARPGTPEFLANNDLPVCIVSNIDAGGLDAALDHNGWSFEHVMTSESARSYKPREEMFEQALRPLT